MFRTAFFLPLAATFAAFASACRDDVSSAVSGDTPTFARDVAPIVYASCTPCHRPGEPTPFSLTSYEEVQKRRRQLVDVTSDRYMPPWLPDLGEFCDDRRLTVAEIELLARWVEAGAPRGDPAVEPPCPEFPSGWQLREPDLVLGVEGELVVPAEGPDSFRNLVIPVPIDRVRYVKAVEIRPDSRAAHHAVMAVDATAESRRLDALDAEPGFPGMIAGNSRPPDGYFLGWTPGKRVHPLPAGMAWRLWPGQDIVLQLHLTPLGKREVVRPRIGLYFTDEEPSAVSYPLVLFSEKIDVPPGVTDYVVEDHVVLPVATRLHSIYPHAHYVCRRMRATATLPDGTVRDLFRIDPWDFDWQDDYRYVQPIALPAGTRIAFEYVYDNSSANPQNPFDPPQRVRFGQESKDEMATLTLQFTTADLDARRALAEASLRRDLEKLGFDAHLLLQLTGLLREMGRNDEALRTIALVREREPDNAEALYELGMCLLTAERPADAERAFAECLQRNAGQNGARIQLANLLARSGRTAAAIALFEAALAAAPRVAPLHGNLATAYYSEGRLADAERHYRAALELDGDYFNAWFLLGRVLVDQGRKTEGRDALLRAQRLQPGNAAVEQALRALE
ncbi:MAG: tetratricopeptide repeat protein [Planctomycetes bacterium]|nr:tetratricopeptide repeat protein [Planctomycetota bacterium]